MAKQTGKKRKTAKKGSAENPFRLDYNQTIDESVDGTHYRAYVVQSQRRKNGPWSDEDFYDKKADSEKFLVEYVQATINDQEYDWRRRNGMLPAGGGSRVSRIVFNEKTSVEQMNKMLADVRKDHKQLLDATGNKTVKPFKPLKYPRFRVVERLAVVAVTETLIAEKGLQDEHDDSVSK